jgi:hypothetical protein
MAVTAKLYTKHFTSLYSANSPTYNTTTAATNQIFCSLHTSTYTPNQNTHQFWSSATNEITGTGYTAGGVRINTSATITDASTSWNILYANASWSSASFTARYAVVFSRGASGSALADAASPLILYVDFGADQTVSSGTFTVQWNASGTVAITVS